MAAVVYSLKFSFPFTTGLQSWMNFPHGKGFLEKALEKALGI